MISTSAKWKQWSAEHGTFHIKAELDNGTKLNLTDEDFMLGSVSITDSVSGMGAFNVGGVITNGFNATLNNFTGKFNHYNLAGATIAVKFGIVWEEGSDTNLFDGVSVVLNQRMANDGTTSAQTNFFYTGYIAVEDGKEYTTNFMFSYMCLFDADKQYLGYATVSVDHKFTASVEGEVVAYAVGNGLLPNISTYYLKKAWVDEWIDRGVYTLEKPTSLGSTIKVTGYDYMDRLNKQYGGSYDILTNMFDSTAITQGEQLTQQGGVIPRQGYFVTDYISVYNNSGYKCNFFDFVCLYDSSKNFLDFVLVSDNKIQTYTLAGTVAYIRCMGVSALLPQYYLKSTPNIFHPAMATNNTVLNQDGTTTALANMFVTEYIGVLDCATYITNLEVTYVCCYDSSFNYLGYVNFVGNVSPRTFTTYISGETVAYVRGCSNSSQLSSTYVQFASGTFLYPFPASRMVEYLCETYGVGFNANSWGLDSFNVNEFEYNENTSCRQVLSWIMEIGGGYARVNPQGVIECRKFNRHEWTSDATLNGGTINPWESVSAISGGTFSPWSSVTDYDGGSTGGAEFTLSKIKSLDVYIEDIEITGIKAFYEQDDEQTFELYGSEGYVLGIDNPMVVADNASEIATRVGDLVNGLSFRPFDASIFGDPSFEAGDVIALKDYLGEEHISLITSLTYSLNQAERLECNAETTMQNSYRW